MKLPELRPKYNSGKQQLPSPEGSFLSRLKQKLQFEKEYIQPHLGDLTFLYRHYCIIFIGKEYVGEGYGTYSGSDDDYDEIGRILARI